MITYQKTYSLIVRILLIGLWAFFFCAIVYVSTAFFVGTKKRELSVCTWGDVFDPEVIAQFENETGIKIKFSYYSSNEELLVMLKTTKGSVFDLIVPTDYAVNILREQRLLKPLDKSRLLFWSQLNPYLLNHYFDPENRYSIPFIWEIHGIGFDKSFFAKGILPDPSWKVLFDDIPVKRVMTNDPLDAFSIAAQYLFGHVEPMTPEKICTIQEILIRQSKHVGAYSSLRPDYFLVTKNFPIAVVTSSLMLRSMQTYPHIGFVVPREGGFMVIENLAMLVSSFKDDLLYTFINFLYRPDIVARHFNKFFYFPSTADIVSSVGIDKKMRELMISPDIIEKLAFFKQVIPEDCLNTLWVRVKTP